MSAKAVLVKKKGRRILEILRPFPVGVFLFFSLFCKLHKSLWVLFEKPLILSVMTVKQGGNMILEGESGFEVV